MGTLLGGSEEDGMTRREFVAAAAVAGAAPALGRAAPQAEIPRRRLGKTGELVSIVGLGGAHLGTQDDERESIRIIHAGLDAGVSFLDNCWDYNGGELLLEAKAASAPDALRYAMSIPGVSVTITGCDRMEILEQALRVARGFTPLTDARRAELLARSAPPARGDWEKYKHTHDFDGTVQHPEWLGHPA